MKIFKVSEGFFRGDRPSSDDDLFQLGKVQNVKTIISLETGFGHVWDGIWGKSFNERNAWVDSWSNVYESQPCSNFTPPTPEHSEIIAKLIDSALIVGPVYLHCYSGVDRTGWMVAHWRVTRQKVSSEAAWEEAIRMGMHFRFFWWKPAFMEICRNAD